MEYSKSAQDLREYCSKYVKRLTNPFNNNIARELKQEELDLALDFFIFILKEDLPEPRLKEIYQKFHSAFQQYLSTSRIYLASILNAIERLSTLFEPFLKKVVYIYFNNRKMPRKRKPLWHGTMEQILNTLNFVKSDIKNDKKEYWVKQPYDQAILRLEYVTRHKGVHEAHIYTLEEIERIANAVIASYVLISLILVYRKEIKKDFFTNIEVKNLLNLIQSKASGYPSTGSLLTIKEHFKLYKYRAYFSFDINILKYLFINYLARNGPIFYWIRKMDKKLLSSWCAEFTKSTNEEIQRNAIRCLIQFGKEFPITYLKDCFLSYELQDEYAKYIQRFSTKNDVDVLFTLFKKQKFEEVSKVAREELVSLTTFRHKRMLGKLALSTKRVNRLLFEDIVLKNVSRGKIDKYKRDLYSKDIIKRLISVYSSGALGNNEILGTFINDIKRKRLNFYLREACHKSITRLLFKGKYYEKVKKKICNRNNFIAETTITCLPKISVKYYFKDLLNVYEKHPYEVGQKIYNNMEKKFIPYIKKKLSAITLDNNSRNLVLCLCKVGTEKEFDFLIRLFLKYPEKIELWYPVYVARCMSKIAEAKNKKIMTKIISSPEFWKYYGRERSKGKRIPIKNYENIYFIKRIIGIVFPAVATRNDFSMLKRMLSHEYKLTAISAARSIGNLTREADLELIIDNALHQDKDWLLENYVSCVCEIDKNIYWNKNYT